MKIGSNNDKVVKDILNQQNIIIKIIKMNLIIILKNNNKF